MIQTILILNIAIPICIFFIWAFSSDDQDEYHIH